MKKQLATLGLMLFVCFSNAQTTWNTTLNNGAASPKLGLSTEHSLNFYTNNLQRMTLTSAGRLGIGTLTPVSEFHVIGKGMFSGSVKTQNSLLLGDYFQIRGANATGTQPFVFSFNTGSDPVNGNPLSDGTTPLAYYKPCNVFYRPFDQNSKGHISQVGTYVPYLPSAANRFVDLIQVADRVAPNTKAIINLGVLNGDGILSLEAAPGVPLTGNEALKINPGCPMNVNICEGGGYTRVFYGADIHRGLNVIGNGMKSFIAVGTDKALSVINQEVIQAGEETFNVFGDGRTLIGANLLPTLSMLTIGQPLKGDVALSLVDNSLTTNNDFFNVYGSGYTEIKIRSPLGLPSNRVLAIRDMANSRDLFVVKSDGKVYAREVEISLAATFPDYVFEKGYKLKPILEVEKFVRDNQHLPGFEKGTYYEQNGINVTDLLLKQQEKLEEQMLYIIQLEKKVEALSGLEARLQALENSK